MLYGSYPDSQNDASRNRMSHPFAALAAPAEAFASRVRVGFGPMGKIADWTGNVWGTPGAPMVTTYGGHTAP